MEARNGRDRKGLAPLAERLRKARLEAGFKKFEDAARKAGLSVNTLKSYEYGKFVPSALNLAALAKAYGVTTDWLLGMNADPTNLPAGKALVNMEAAIAILGARSREEILPYLESGPNLTSQCVFEIPSRGKVVALREAVILGQKIVAKIQRLAPDVAERWEILEEGVARD